MKKKLTLFVALLIVASLVVAATPRTFEPYLTKAYAPQNEKPWFAQPKTTTQILNTEGPETTNIYDYGKASGVWDRNIGDEGLIACALMGTDIPWTYHLCHGTTDWTVPTCATQQTTTLGVPKHVCRRLGGHRDDPTNTIYDGSIIIVEGDTTFEFTVIDNELVNGAKGAPSDYDQITVECVADGENKGQATIRSSSSWGCDHDGDSIILDYTTHYPATAMHKRSGFTEQTDNSYVRLQASGFKKLPVDQPTLVQRVQKIFKSFSAFFEN